MGKFSDYLDDIKNQTDGLRTIVSDKSGVDCANLSIEGVAEVVKNISFDKEPVLQEKFVDPDIVTKIVEADAGYDGLSKVHFTAVTSAIDSNILADNIKKDVTILGVTGTLEEGGAEDLTEELTAQDTALTSLESAVDKLPEPKPDRLQWVCDNVKRLDYEFYNYKGTSLDEVLTGLDTSQVTNMSYLCASCSNLTSIPQLDTSNVTNMRDMFSGCKALTTIPELDTRNATTVRAMFSSCSNITTIPELNTSKVTDMTSMFDSCTKLTTTPLLDMVALSTSPSYFLNACKNITNLNLKNIKWGLQIGSRSDWGHLLTDESIINTAQELWDKTGSTSQKLTLSTPSNARLDAIYVKLIEATADMIANDEYITNKKPCVVCESTDEGAMTLREFILSKNWTIA